jgi:hypothetical protein
MQAEEDDAEPKNDPYDEDGRDHHQRVGLPGRCEKPRQMLG